VLIDWINGVLVGERIIVGSNWRPLWWAGSSKALRWGICSGKEPLLLFHYSKTQYYIVYLFPEKLEGEKLNVAEMTQCEIAQKQKKRSMTASKFPPGTLNGLLTVCTVALASFLFGTLCYAVHYCSSLSCLCLFATRTVSFILFNTNCGHWVFHWFCSSRVKSSQVIFIYIALLSM